MIAARRSGSDPVPPNRHRDPSGSAPWAGTSVAAGFTLLELIIALALVAVLVTLAVPGFRESLAESRLQGVQGALTATFRQAHAEAGLRREPVIVCARASGDACGEDWSDGWLAFVDAAGGTPSALDAGETVLLRQEPVAGRRISITASRRTRWSSTTEPTPSLTFEPRQRGDTALFVICDPRGAARARTVVRRLSGAVQTSLGRNAAGERTGPWNRTLACPA